MTDDLVELLSTDSNRLGLIQSGLRAVGEGPEPNHRATFTSTQSRFDLGDADELVVPLGWTDGAGISVEKRFRFTRGSYTIVLEQEITNNSDAPWRGAEYAQLQRRSFEQERSMFDVDSYSFDGPIVYDGDKSEKLARDDLIVMDPILSLRTEAGSAQSSTTSSARLCQRRIRANASMSLSVMRYRQPAQSAQHSSCRRGRPIRL